MEACRDLKKKEHQIISLFSPSFGPIPRFPWFFFTIVSKKVYWHICGEQRKEKKKKFIFFSLRFFARSDLK